MDRRSFIAAASVAAVVAAPAVAMASTASADSELLAAFEVWKRTTIFILNMPANTPPGEPTDDYGYTASEAAAVKARDQAELLLQRSVARTPQGVIAQLAVALAHTEQTREIEFALAEQGIAGAHAQGDQLDWPSRLIVSAIHSLETMEA